MSIFVCIILDALLIAFFFGGNILDVVLPRRVKLRRQLKALRKQLRSAVERNHDLLTARQHDTAEKLGGEIRQALAAAPETYAEAKKADALINGLSERIAAATAIPGRRFGSVANVVETLAVSIGVAFGLRALFVQPFKIPTGSMQPTLFGIHFQTLPQNGGNALKISSIGRFRRIFDYVNYSRRYLLLETPAGNDATLVEWWNAEPMPSAPLFPKSRVKWRTASATPANGTFTIPASVTDVRRIFAMELNQAEDTGASINLGGGRRLYQPGETIAAGAMESGDHLFVNRLSLCFRAPRRGDMMVFSTAGLNYNGKPLGGDFYIKRLVGMPGDTLKIVNGALYFRPIGDESFHLADGSVHPDFDKINSMADGYNGYSVIPYSDFLNKSEMEYTVPDECYFMLGDNTNNSLDSRFWGAVPRQNLVGRPCFVWWPFSKRFGFTR